MPVGMTLGSKSVILRFPPLQSTQSDVNTYVDDDDNDGQGQGPGREQYGEPEESYQLLELPPEILKRVEANKGATFPLTIKGKPSDDAVLCTANSTFLLRTIGISNSLLVCRTPSSSSSSSSSSATTTPTPDSIQRPILQVRDICHQVLECVPIAPNLERIRNLLKESAWKGLNADVVDDDDPSSSSDDDDEDRRTSAGAGLKRKRGRGIDRNHQKKKKKTKRWTREQLESVVQASEQELERGLKERNVIQVDGRMLYLPPVPLKELLTIILSLITIHSSSPSSSSKSGTPIHVPSEPILSALTDDYSCSLSFSREILILLSTTTTTTAFHNPDSQWTVDITKIVREIGMAILHSPTLALPARQGAGAGASLSNANDLSGGKTQIPLDDFLHLWKSEVGEDWEDYVDIKLLEGEYLLTPSNSTLLNTSLITPFPSSALALHPATRFADLFLTRHRWRPDDMAPFLRGLTREGDNKERDKLVAKYVRVVKEKEGVWWYPRR